MLLARRGLYPAVEALLRGETTDIAIEGAPPGQAFSAHAAVMTRDPIPPMSPLWSEGSRLSPAGALARQIARRTARLLCDRGMRSPVAEGRDRRGCMRRSWQRARLLGRRSRVVRRHARGRTAGAVVFTTVSRRRARWSAGTAQDFRPMNWPPTQGLRTAIPAAEVIYSTTRSMMALRPRDHITCERS